VTSISSVAGFALAAATGNVRRRPVHCDEPSASARRENDSCGAMGFRVTYGHKNIPRRSLDARPAARSVACVAAWVNIGDGDGGGVIRSAEIPDPAENADDQQINQSIDSYLDRSVYNVVVVGGVGGDCSSADTGYDRPAAQHRRNSIRHSVLVFGQRAL